MRKCGLFFTVRKIVKSLPRNERTKLPFIYDTPGQKWYDSFLKRHPFISAKKAEYLSILRKKVTESKIRNWFESVRNQLGSDFEVMEDPDHIFNMDETSFYLMPSGSIVLARKGKPVYEVSQKSDKENITVSLAISASGIQGPSFVVYKYI